MNYLKIFSNYLETGSAQDISVFDDILQQDISKTRLDFLNDGETFIIEPVNVTERKDENNEYFIYHYQGDYIYGFEKDGIFYEVPGDPTSKTERKQNENGEMAFYVNKLTNRVETVTETFAENFWGKKQRKKFLFW